MIRSVPISKTQATNMEIMPMKKLKIKYGELTVELGEMSWWAWGMFLCAGVLVALGVAHIWG